MYEKSLHIHLVINSIKLILKNMKTVEFKEEDLVKVNELTEQRNDIIEHLNDVLKINDSITEKKSLELLQDIFKINSQFKLEEDKLIIKTLTDNGAL